jgi:hypothetical protein
MEIIRKEIVPALITTVLLGLAGFLSGIIDIDQLSSLVLPAIIVLVFLIVLLHFLRPIRQRLVLWIIKAERSNKDSESFELALKKLINESNGSALKELTGIKITYPNFDASIPRLEEYLTNAVNIRLLTYTGQSDIGKGTGSYRRIAHNDKRNLSVKILLCSPESKFVSPEYAEILNHQKERSETWKKRIFDTQNDIRQLKEHHQIDISMRAHFLPFVWRLWFVDNVLFVTSMMYSTGQKNLEVPVFELWKSDNNQLTLYEMFEKHFEEEWKKADDIQ